MFLGRLDWPPNRDGMCWFLERVWPKLHQNRPQLQLSIAGSGDGAWLENFADLPQIEILGRIEDPKELYSRSLLAIVPVFYGSGTRVKAIEASACSCGCISTAFGVEGLGLQAGKSYLRAETEQEWVQQLSSLSAENAAAVGAAAYQHLRESFEVGAAARKFQKLLEELRSVL